ncbi:MAG: thiol reductant ABC exporter subunit CydD, partial [Dietzia sp.]|nr:thiol reductant ABC exporter subunit CydD [Dietzia sp.]
MRRFLVATTVCGALTAACTIASAVVLAGVVSRVITDPTSREFDAHAVPIGILLALWVVRALVLWLQNRLAQRGASSVIADLSDRVLNTATSLPPRELNRRRDEAAVVVTRGLDGLRLYFTTYLPSLFLAAILTPTTAAVIALYDWPSAVIVLIAL